MVKKKYRGTRHGRALCHWVCSAAVLMAIGNLPAQAQTLDTIAIPLQHVPSEDDATDFDALGIMIGVNGSTPRLYQFDTGSDMFMGQIDEA